MHFCFVLPFVWLPLLITIAALKEQAASQLRLYAADEKGQKSKGHTTLRLLTLLFRGWELEAEEVV